jgi:hypothetical protein
MLKIPQSFRSMAVGIASEILKYKNVFHSRDRLPTEYRMGRLN